MNDINKIFWNHRSSLILKKIMYMDYKPGLCTVKQTQDNFYMG
jgi:hypothetical protein